MPGGDFTLYFLAYGQSSSSDDDSTETKFQKQFQREGKITNSPAQLACLTGVWQGILELTHNHGTEEDAAFQYHIGNNSTEGVRGGYGHIAIIVDDAKRACDRFEALGVPFQKRLEDGKMKNIAFIKDPDG